MFGPGFNVVENCRGETSYRVEICEKCSVNQDPKSTSPSSVTDMPRHKQFILPSKCLVVVEKEYISEHPLRLFSHSLPTELAPTGHST